MMGAVAVPLGRAQGWWQGASDGRGNEKKDGRAIRKRSGKIKNLKNS